MSTKIFVIIVTFNGSKWIDRCLLSLRKSTIALDTIVIDNRSTDDTLSRVETGYSEVYIVRAGQNLGFGKANNIGMEIAHAQGADYVFLLNQDAWIEPDAIEQLVEGHRMNPAYSIISPMHLNGSGNAIEYGFSNFIAPNKCADLYSDIFFGTLKGIYDAPFVNAAAWLVTRECLEKIGGFSPSFFHYGEDDNYTDRVRYHGMKLGVLPRARILHDRERGRSPTFFETGEVFKRELIQRSSNPNIEVSFTLEWVALIAHLISAVVRCDGRGIRLQWKKLKLFNTIDRKVIAINREKSKLIYSTFLDFDREAANVGQPGANIV